MIGMIIMNIKMVVMMWLGLHWTWGQNISLQHGLCSSIKCNRHNSVPWYKVSFFRYNLKKTISSVFLSKFSHCKEHLKFKVFIFNSFLFSIWPKKRPQHFRETQEWLLSMIYKESGITSCYHFASSMFMLTTLSIPSIMS